MKITKHIWKLLALLLAAGLIAAACGSDSDDDGDSAATATTARATTTTAAAATTTTEAAGCESIDDMTLQLQWFTQAQFAGYYAAVDQGFYENLCLNVDILEGGVDIVPVDVLSSGGADVAISWVPRVLEVFDGNSDVDAINVAQVFERSGTLQVSFRDSDINSVSDLRGRTVGNWGFGNEIELFAGLRNEGIDPGDDVTTVRQDFNMTALINGDIDAAQAMIYNEYAQVLETVNPDTDELFTADDLNIINWNDEGTAMLQDAIWADISRLEDADYRDMVDRFVEASLEGWIYCRDNFNPCVDIVLANGSELGRSHQTWQLNEINNLIWPAQTAVGVMVESLATQTEQVMDSSGGLDDPVGSDWYRSDIAEAAVERLQARGLDTKGDDWTPRTVTLNEGGN